MSDSKGVILIIEDDPSFLDSIAVYMRTRGFEVLTARDGAAGIALYEKEEPDLVLSDLRMPITDGFGVLRHIRDLDSDTPVIVISGAGDIEDLIQALRLGAQDFVQKPILRMSILDHAIQRALEHIRLQRENQEYLNTLERKVRERTEDLYQANTHLRKSEQRFRNLVSSLPLAVCESDSRGNITYANEKAFEIFGYDLTTVSNKLSILDTIAPVDRARALDNVKQVLDGGVTRRAGTEYLALRADGKTFPVVVYSSPIDEPGHASGMRTVIVDVSEQKKAELALSQERNLLHTTINLIPDMVYVKDTDSRIILCNQAYADFLNIEDPEQVIGKTLTELLSEEIGQISEEQDSYVIKTGESLIEEPVEGIHPKTGVLFSFVTSKIPLIDSEGKVSGLVGINRDVTEMKKAKKLEEERRAQLIQADKMISLGVLVSGVAHEINNPTHAIMTHAAPLKNVWPDIKTVLDAYYDENGEFLLSGIDYPSACELIPGALSEIIRSAHRIKEIVNELRDFARKDSGADQGEVNLNRVAKSAVTLMENMLRKHTSNFELTFGEGLPPIKGNYQRLEQVIVNLLQNACQALPSQECCIRLYTSFDPLNKECLITIEDDGIGIPEEDLAHITDPFFTTKRDLKGTGLGLSISSGIVMEHQGKLSFSSQVSQGTTAVIRFPALGPMRPGRGV